MFGKTDIEFSTLEHFAYNNIINYCIVIIHFIQIGVSYIM